MSQNKHSSRREFLLTSLLAGVGAPMLTQFDFVADQKFWGRVSGLIDPYLNRTSRMRFVVFTLPKSGSNLLSHWINHHAKYLYFNGFFVRRPELLQEQVLTAHANDANFGKKSKNFLELFHDLDSVKSFIDRRDQDFLHFANNLMKLPHSQVGFKFEPYFNGWQEDGSPLMDPYKLVERADQEGWKIVTLKRRQDFEQYMSLLISLETNFFSFDSNKEKPALYREGQISVASRSEEFYDLAKLSHKNRKFLSALDKKSGTLSVDYEDLIQGKNISALEDMMKVSAAVIPSIEKKKLNRRYEDCFDNPDLLREIYDDAKFSV